MDLFGCGCGCVVSACLGQLERTRKERQDKAVEILRRQLCFIKLLLQGRSFACSAHSGISTRM
eukprot:scaffold36701_cov394-Skeletonema_dohrnii-CCMP3373.AAC.2